MKLNKIAVIGAGLMGTGIAHASARGGFTVSVMDISTNILNKSKKEIDRLLSLSVEKGRSSKGEAKNLLNRLSFTKDIKDAAGDADFIIETVTEDLEVKRKIFSELEKTAKASCIFASNTSVMSIRFLANSTNRPEQVIGTHWFYPPQAMKFIEVAVSAQTSKATLETTLDFCKKIGKETVVCKDAQGFITSRAISAFIAECLRIHEEGIASIEDIDKAIRLGFKHPIGPFQLVDMSGVDTVHHALEALRNVYGDRFKPTREMKRLVESDNLGQKTGKGFYYHRSTT